MITIVVIDLVSGSVMLLLNRNNDTSYFFYTFIRFKTFKKKISTVEGFKRPKPRLGHATGDGRDVCTRLRPQNDGRYVRISPARVIWVIGAGRSMRLRSTCTRTLCSPPRCRIPPGHLSSAYAKTRILGLNRRAATFRPSTETVCKLVDNRPGGFLRPRSCTRRAVLLLRANVFDFELRT